MANELNEVGGPTNPKGNPISDPNKYKAATQNFFGTPKPATDKRTESQFGNK
jgi:hypothetical protein